MIGTPACLHAHEAKYAHHGPTPGLPAVAERYMAMRGELFEPGGCSVCPTSPAAAATMAEPVPDAPATGAIGLVVPSAPGPMAPWSIPAKELGVWLVVAVSACGGAGGLKACCRAWTRASTDSTDTLCASAGLARRFRAQKAEGAARRPPPLDPSLEVP